jgi:hypothetical protein
MTVPSGLRETGDDEKDGDGQGEENNFGYELE